MPGLIVASAAFAQGCIEPDVTSGPRGAIDAEYARAAVGGDYDLGEDAHMMELARQVPGFAGFHYEPGSEDRVVVAMRRKDRDGFPAARSAVAGLMAGSLVDAAAFVQRRVDYSFLELAANRALLRPRLFALPGVASLSVDEEANRIAIGVSDGSAVPAVEALADDLGVPHKMLAFELGVHPIAGSSGFGVSSLADDVAQTLEDQIDTLQSGYMATSHRAVCTIGPTGTVGRGNPTGRPTQVFFSNAHCTWIQFDHDYEYPNWGQPHWGWNVGREWGDPSPRRCWHWKGVRRDCREADAAVIYVDPDAPFASEIALGKIARTKRRTNDNSKLSIEIHQSAPTITISGVRHWNVKNEILDKIGRVTGWTYGPVKKTCDDLVGTFKGKEMLILCSDRVDYIRREGDSGSPVFRYNNGYAQLRGIHWGGEEGKDGAVSDLEQIKKDFDRWYPGTFDQTWFYDPGPPRYLSIGGPTEVLPQHECRWKATARGMSPFVYRWSGILSGTGKRVRGSVEEPGYLVVSIRDVLWREARDSIWVSVSNEAERCSPPPPPFGEDSVPGIDTLPPPPN